MDENDDGLEGNDGEDETDAEQGWDELLIKEDDDDVYIADVE